MAKTTLEAQGEDKASTLVDMINESHSLAFECEEILNSLLDYSGGPATADTPDYYSARMAATSLTERFVNIRNNLQLVKNQVGVI